MSKNAFLLIFFNASYILLVDHMKNTKMLIDFGDASPDAPKHTQQMSIPSDILGIGFF